jgi:hypothetical protein
VYFVGVLQNVHIGLLLLNAKGTPGEPGRRIHAKEIGEE